MSDFGYRCVYLLGDHVFLLSSRTTILHRERAAIPGGYILVAPHTTPFDVPLMIRHAPRFLDFMSVVEMKRHAFVRWFFGLMNTFYLDRSKKDAATLLNAVHRLKRGRAIAMFPEGGIRTTKTSVLNGGNLKPGVAGLAELSGAPVIPCVVLGASSYESILSWAPIGAVRYGVIFGEPMYFVPGEDRAAARQAFLNELKDRFISLRDELAVTMEKKPRRSTVSLNGNGDRRS